MASNYINKSLRGKAIITNLDIEGELNINTNILNQSSGTYNIGSSTSNFNELFIKNINISSQNISNFIRNEITGTSGIISTNGSLSLNITEPLKLSQGSLILGLNKPLRISEGNLAISLQQPLRVSNGTMVITLLEPLAVINGSIGVKLAKAKIDINPTTSEIDKIFVNTDGELDYNPSNLIKSGKGITKESYLEQLGDLAGGININPLPDLTYIGTDIDKEQLTYNGNKISILSKGFTNIPFYNAFGLEVANENVFTYSKLNNRLNVGAITLDTDVNNQSPLKSAVNKTYVDNLNLLATKSGLQQVQSNQQQNPNTRYWNVRVDDTTIKIDENNNLKTSLIPKQGSVITIDPDNIIDLSIDNTLKVEDNKLGVNLSGSGPIITSNGNVSLQYDNQTIILNEEGKLKVALSVKEGQQPIVITAQEEIDFQFNDKQFQIANFRLQSLLSTPPTSALSLNPDYQLEVIVDNTTMKIVDNKLKCDIFPKAGSAITLDANQDLDLQINNNQFQVVSGSLTSKLDGVGAISLNPSHQISVAVNPQYLKIAANQITFSTAYEQDQAQKTQAAQDVATQQAANTGQIASNTATGAANTATGAANTATGVANAAAIVVSTAVAATALAAQVAVIGTAIAGVSAAAASANALAATANAGQIAVGVGLAAATLTITGLSIASGINTGRLDSLDSQLKGPGNSVINRLVNLEDIGNTLGTRVFNLENTAANIFNRLIPLENTAANILNRLIPLETNILNTSSNKIFNNITISNILVNGSSNFITDVNGVPPAFRINNINTGGSAFSSLQLGNTYLFQNSSTRGSDGGVNTSTLRNDIGSLRIQTLGQNGIFIQATTGNVGLTGVSTPNAALQFNNNLVNKKIVLFELNNNEHEYHGFGVNGAIMRYQVSNLGSNHVFFSGVNSTTSNEVFRISGTGNITVPGTTNSIVVSTGTLFVSGTINNLQLTSFGNRITSLESNISTANTNISTNSINIFALINGTGSNKIFNSISTGSLFVGTISNIQITNLSSGNLTNSNRITVLENGASPTNTSNNTIFNSITANNILITDELRSYTGINKTNVILNQVENNIHQVYGFGILRNVFNNPLGIRYQTPTGKDHIFFSGTSSTSSNQLFRITGSGNVGIGIDPTTKLHVLGNTLLEGSATINNLNVETLSVNGLIKSNGTFLNTKTFTTTSAGNYRFAICGGGQFDAKFRITSNLISNHSSFVLDINGIFSQTDDNPTVIIKRAKFGPGTSISTFTISINDLNYESYLYLNCLSSTSLTITQIEGNNVILNTPVLEAPLYTNNIIYTLTNNNIILNNVSINKFGLNLAGGISLTGSISNLQLGNITTRLTNIESNTNSTYGNTIFNNITVGNLNLTGSAVIQTGNLNNLNVSNNSFFQSNVNGAPPQFKINNINTGSGAYSILGVNNTYLFQNSSTRTGDGGVNTSTLRNDSGSLRLQGVNNTGITIIENTNVISTNDSIIKFNNNETKRKIVLYDVVANSNHKFYGLGVDTGKLRYQSDGEHVFYNSYDDLNSRETLRLQNNGIVKMSSLLIEYSPSQVGCLNILAGQSNVGARIYTAPSLPFIQFFALNSDFSIGAQTGDITHNGSNTTYNTSSDRRLKENIKPMEDSLEKLKNIKFVSYNYINIKTNKSEGVLADELQEIVPHAVSGVKNGLEYQQVNYQALIPMLGASIQELSKTVEKLLKRIDELENNVERNIKQNTE